MASSHSNLLLNVGPMSDGTLDPVFEERLLEMGAWLDVNGEAIYNTVPWKYQNDTPAQDMWYTAAKVRVTSTTTNSPHPFMSVGNTINTGSDFVVCRGREGEKGC